MSIEVAMPALSPTMEAGTLARWLVREGDVVAAGALLAEVETDKATMELEAAEGGVITRLLVAEGTEDVRVGAPVALIAPVGEGASAPLTALTPAVESAAPATPPPAPAPMVEAAPVAAAAVLPAEPPASLRVSPLARRMARAARIELSGVTGSGPRGKIVAADLGQPLRAEALAPSPRAAPAPVAAWAESPPPSAPHRSVKLSGMRKTIARRLTEAKQTVPHFYLGMDIRMDSLFAFRAELNASAGEGGVKVSVNDLMIKALATALEDTPDANVQFAGDRLLQFDRVDVSMAVAVPGGLVTPVIQDAGGKRLNRIAAEAKALAERARKGQLAPEEYEGGTVSLSNLGMFGVTQMTPVINPPQALILGIPAAGERPWSQDGQIVSAKVMTVTASFDHRAIDGATGAAFLARFKQLVERPLAILA